jgi:translation initiation factor 2 alpha subunit (eIF-2alpha)
MAPPYHDRGGTSKSDHPQSDSIERGEIVRIEDFWRVLSTALEHYRGMRGLVHINQIASTRLEESRGCGFGARYLCGSRYWK